ncbi:MAG: nickel-dependent lactate racemase [Deltaproteobacteria bacterium]|nr:nickel-dependent lactate racemase [Deltaproteobacteria bacterium]
MRVELCYGRGMLPLDLPDELSVTVVRKPAMPVLPDGNAAVEVALARPIGAPPLAEEARVKRSACILICDVTRPVPNGLLLPPLLRTLLGAGMRADDIRILVATGLHRPNLGEELRELVGDDEVLRTVRVENHDARDDAAHLDLGRTPAGTPVKLDRRFVEAELKIATGLVEPHFMAGYSGGRKVIAPGVAHRETITTFHSARFMAHPRADNCVLEGNPLHEEQLAIARMLGPVRAVNAVIDEARALSFVSYGELLQSHAAAVAFVERYFRVPVPERFATVVTSAAGHPLDKTYYQTVKGMVAPLDILRPGGDLVVVSACSEGMGSREYVAAQERLLRSGVEGFWEEIREKRFADVDEWQTQMQLRPMRQGQVHLYTTGLSEADRARTGVRLAASAEAAVRESVARSGDRRVAVIPEGPYLVPVYRPG